MIGIGARIRQARLERGLSQGDLESRTGLLRCYLSRVENGHTEPSLQTLARLAAALEMPLVGFFDEAADDDAAEAAPPQLSADELTFLTQMRDFAGTLSEQGRQQVLGLAKKMAGEKKDPAAKP
ncbi:MAG TPA: helix-turn-helix transcriptional regulator [Terriglobales bacterium]|nr:helix-turn-helix transcriptional regulator [Terriglobales bacterium]